MTPQFEAAIKTYGPRFKADLMLDNLKVSGMFGNFAQENNQFRTLQEGGYKGKKDRQGRQLGGYGWPQWTGWGEGGRRRLYTEWCTKNGVDPAADESNYGFIIHELRTAEKAALAALKRTRTLDTATETFMLKYERPGKPHLDRRKAFALEALHVLETAIGTEAIVAVQPPKRTVSPVPIATGEGPQPAAGGFFGSLLGKLTGKATPPPVAAPVVPGDPEVYRIQKALYDLGYTEVGLLDGIHGPGTSSAIDAIRQENHLAPGNKIDDELRALLMKAPKRTVSPARAGATPATVAQHGPVKEMNRAWWAGGLFPVIFGALGGADQTGVLDSVKGAADGALSTFQSLQTLIVGLLGAVQWCFHHWWIFAIVGGLYVAYRTVRGVLETVVLFRQGVLRQVVK